MADGEQQDQIPEAPAKKEAAVLSNESLTALAKHVQDKSMVLAMLLNIPTTKLVNIRLDGTEKECNEEAMCTAMLKYWKEMRGNAKDKDKIADLQRGLKDAGYVEVAEVVDERSKDNVELTSDCFPAA